MIEIKQGNVLDVETGIIVHGCNAQGVMGAGIALEIKQRFPDAYKRYVQEYNKHGLRLGSITYVEVAPTKFIVNAITQDFYSHSGGRMVSYDAVVDCFAEVTRLATALKQERNIYLDIVFPKIGAGLGGGNWDIIRSIIDTTVPDVFLKTLYVFNP